MLKSHGPDLPYARRLLNSFSAYNQEGLELHVVVPPGDLPDFRMLERHGVTIVDEREFGPYLAADDVNGYRRGYINQEIVKLAFWELGTADAVFMIDSDAEFLRPFGARDFLAGDGTPFTFVTEDRWLQAEPQYHREYWDARRALIGRIEELLGFTPDFLRTAHGNTLFASAVLQSWKEEFLGPRGWSYLDAVTAVPLEFSWYSLWEQKRQPVPFVPREPIVKTFHNRNQHIESILRGETADVLARRYVAAIVNSNYARYYGMVSVRDPASRVLAAYLGYGQILAALRG
jgi:hypothetical protein